MPIVTQLVFLRDTLDDLVLPLGLGTLTAFVEPPPDPVQTIENPSAWVWPSTGEESRQTVPRAQPGNLDTGGNKTQEPQVSIWLRWTHEPSTDPLWGLWWPAIVDAVMARLRNVAMLDAAQHATDPVTGRLSNLLNVGENLSWEMPPSVVVEGTEGLRRYDALVVCGFIDIFQA